VPSYYRIFECASASYRIQRLTGFSIGTLEHLTRFKAPRTVVFGPLPKTATGKIQKFLLRERAKEVV